MFLELTAKFNSGNVSFRFSNQKGLDHIANTIEKTTLSGYEAPFPMVFANLAHALGGYFYDVGANTGIYSLLVASANPTIKVIAFEPLDHVRKILELNVKGNAYLKKRIKVYPIALSNKEGKFTFYETINDRGLVTTSSSFERDYAQAAGQFREIRIAATTLAGWQKKAEAFPPSFMKIDVEGHERAVLEGGEELISTSRPIIILELLGPADFPFFTSFINRHNYLDIVCRPTGAEILERPRFVGQSWNHIFCPGEKLEIIKDIFRSEQFPFECGAAR